MTFWFWPWWPMIYHPPDNRKGYHEIAEAIRFAAMTPAERAAEDARRKARANAEAAIRDRNYRRLNLVFGSIVAGAALICFYAWAASSSASLWPLKGANMNFIFWILTLGVLDDIRRQGMTPAQRKTEDVLFFIVAAIWWVIIPVTILLLLYCRSTGGS